MQKEYQNYIFDLYGTLVDIRTNERSSILWDAFSWYLCLIGIPFEAESLYGEYYRLCRTAEIMKEQDLALRGIVGPSEIDIQDVWRMLGNEKGVSLSAQQCDEISRVFRALSLQHLKLFPETINLLRTLREHQKKIYLLSNAQASFTRPELRFLGLTTAFDAIFISSEVGVKKPSPAFFNLLLQEGVSPEKSIMIGNDIECDCRGASNASMDSIFINSTKSADLSPLMPDNCVQVFSLHDVYFTI